MSETQTPAPEVPAAPVTPPPAAAVAPASAASTDPKLKAPGGLSGQHRTAAKGEKPEEERTPFGNLPLNQQGLIGALIALFKILGGGNADFTNIMAALTGTTPEDFDRRMTEARERGQTAEQAAAGFSYSSDPAKRQQQIEAAQKQAPVSLSHQSDFKPADGELKMARPVDEKFRMSSPFGHREHPTRGGRAHHDDVDYATPDNTPIKAPAAGQVVYAGPSSGYGNIIILDHGKGVYSLYGHLDAHDNDLKQVKVGDVVQKGQQFATTGASGVGTGAHLHYEVLIAREGKAPINVDPAKAMSADLSKPETRSALVEDAIRTAGGVGHVETKVAALQPARPSA